MFIFILKKVISLFLLPVGLCLFLMVAGLVSAPVTPYAAGLVGFVRGCMVASDVPSRH